METQKKDTYENTSHPIEEVQTDLGDYALLEDYDEQPKDENYINRDFLPDWEVSRYLEWKQDNDRLNLLLSNE